MFALVTVSSTPVLKVDEIFGEMKVQRNRSVRTIMADK